MDSQRTASSSVGRVLIVDDDEAITTLFKRLLGAHGYQVHVEPDGMSALHAVHTWKPELVIVNVVLPNVDGVEVCRQIKQDPATRLLPAILVTAHDESEKRIEGAAAGADEFLLKPVDVQELVARVNSLIRLRRSTEDLDSATSIILMLATMVESRDGYTVGHCHRMANYAAALGRSIGLGHDDLQTLRRGGFLHDIGMLAIPDTVLRKRGSLDAEEYELIKSHTLIGDSLCAPLRSLQSVRPIVRHHHERIDGSGYPDGLRGDQIPLLAQIIGLVDTYEALTTERPYQSAQDCDDAIEILWDQVRRGWRQANLIESFVSLIESRALESSAMAASSPP